MFVVQLKAAGSWRSCIWLMTWFRTVRKRVLSSPKTSKASWLMPAHMWPGKLTLTCVSCVHQRDFVLSHVCSVCFSGRDGDDGCKKHMERLLNIWQERNLYRPDFIQQLKLAIEDSDSPKHKPAGQNNTTILHSIYLSLVVCLVWHATHTTYFCSICIVHTMQISFFSQICLLVFKRKKVLTVTKLQTYLKWTQCIHSCLLCSPNLVLCKDVYVLTFGILVK